MTKLRRNPRSELKDLIDELEAKFVDHSTELFVRRTKLTDEMQDKLAQRGKTNNKGKRQPRKKNQKNIEKSDSES